MPLLYRCLAFIHGKGDKIGRRPSTAFERLVYSTLIAIFDTLDVVVLRWSSPFDKKLEDRVRKTHSHSSFVLNPCFDAAHRV